MNMTMMTVTMVVVPNLQMSFRSEWVEFLRAEPAAFKRVSINKV